MKYYLFKDYGKDGYSLEEYESLEHTSKEIEREMEENFFAVVQYRVFEVNEFERI